jgi:hypothetical protein
MTPFMVILCFCPKKYKYKVGQHIKKDFVYDEIMASREKTV